MNSPGESKVVNLEEYRAAVRSDHTNHWLQLRLASGRTVGMRYDLLSNISADTHRDHPPSEIVLQFHQEMLTRPGAFAYVATVTVRGHDLQGHLAGFLSRTLSVIEEFDPRKHASPAAGAPVVTSIEIVDPSHRIDR